VLHNLPENYCCHLSAAKAMVPSIYLSFGQGSSLLWTHTLRPCQREQLVSYLWRAPSRRGLLSGPPD